MRMARVNVYLPDDLAAAAKAADLNVSRLTQDALRKALAASEVDRWLTGLGSLESIAVSDDAVAAALAQAKDEVAGLD